MTATLRQESPAARKERRPTLAELSFDFEIWVPRRRSNGLPIAAPAVRGKEGLSRCL